MPRGESRNPPVPAPERQYFAAIERRVQQLRGSPILLSPREWMRINSWWEQGIPREVVLAGIEATFARPGARARGTAVRSLAYCEPVILDTWERQRHESVTRGEAHRGPKGGPAGPDRLRECLDAATRALGRLIARAGGTPAEATLRECLREVEREAGKGRPGPDPAREERLERLERELARAARHLLSPADLTRIDAEVDADLHPYRGLMPSGTLRETRELLREDRFRRALDLPRISLFGRS